MTEQKVMTILGREIPVGNDQVNVSELRFLPENPRVYAVTHGTAGFSELSEEEQQQAIFRTLCDEPSVKNLKKEVKRHGGLIEPIVVRTDTHQVIEGNSRLAVYRLLLHDAADGEWDRIPCELVSGLSDEEQAAYLQQIHVTGKTQWSAYEKANFAYVQHRERKRSVSRIAELFGESPPTIRKKISVIQMMADNGDTERSRFSYYEVLFGLFSPPKLRTDARASQELSDPLRKNLLERIARFGVEERKNEFTAMEMRSKVPSVMKKPKILRKFIAGELTLEDAFDLAKETRVEMRLRKAVQMLRGIERSEVENLESTRVGAFAQQVRRAKTAVDRLRKIADEVRQKQ